MPTPLVRLASLDLIRGFVAVGRRMSITLAAEDLCLTQSALSRQVHALEDLLGIALFKRGYRSISFTPEGERLFRTADTAVQQLQDVFETLNQPQGRMPVTITASIGVTGLWLLPRLNRFQQRHPNLDLRVAPGEVAAFEARLRQAAGDAGGTLLFDKVDGEDITRQLIDADAALRAKRTLRDRLQALLETHQGRLADLLEVEKALSTTQQELDAATAELAELRQRVDLSKLSISYRAARPLGPIDRPLAGAVAGLGHTLASSLALLLSATVAVLPWLPPLALLVRLVRRWRRGRRAPPL